MGVAATCDAAPSALPAPRGGCYDPSVSNGSVGQAEETKRPKVRRLLRLRPVRGRPFARWRRDLLFAAVAAAVLALDQATKHIVRATLEQGEAFPEGWHVRFVHVENTGAAFGILQEQNAFLVVTTVIGVAAILLYYWYPLFEHGIMTAALGMMLGGAIGNLSDRVRLGEVTDFLKFPEWPAFNVADSSIVVGVVSMSVFLVLMRPDRPPEQPPGP
jgi:signal peptidase II